MSAGVVHASDGMLQQLALVREDARGPWPSATPDKVAAGCEWSASTEAAAVSGERLAAALERAGAPTEGCGVGFALSASLELDAALERPWQSTRVGSCAALRGSDGSGSSASSDVVLLCEEARVAIVAPMQRSDGSRLCSGVAWWPAATEHASAVLYTIEAAWDVNGSLEELRYLVFR
uniref:Uncharacterized protein n=1 Tax=Calcidiscus leptoporus TaxID=127549 RepID=A0A7S0P227_9EUKA|mmetsp:Transcript_51079/g.117470  ORF Transcript_51079/g.117470 Transcript_51079/m.117470 type:complete len:178 (+) Transcript_51079:3-536(+)